MLTLDQLQAVLPFMLVGFLAQLVDGALGMAFGLITNLMLVSVVGVAPARSSATVHLVECFTTAASAISHILHRNVDWPLLAKVAGPGVVGGVLGAYVITGIDASAARPLVMVYLAAIGLYLLWRAWRMTHGPSARPVRFVRSLGLTGGFLDAAGGGGWGPIVTANLLMQGSDPRTTIGTVNTAELLVTIAVSLTFLWQLGPAAFSTAAVGLILGGLLAAPLGARIASRMDTRRLLVLVGGLITLTSGWQLLAAVW